jgi:hypothetical protein
MGHGDWWLYERKSRFPFDFAQGTLSTPLKYAALRMTGLLSNKKKNCAQNHSSPIHPSRTIVVLLYDGGRISLLVPPAAGM